MDDALEFHNINTEIKKLEKEIEISFKKFEKKEEIEFSRCYDYGERGFNLTLYFDEINIKALSDENINKIKLLLVKYRELRKKQKILESEFINNNAIKNQQNLDVIGGI